MDSYNLNFKPSVEKDLKVLSRKLAARVLESVELLRDDPFPRRAVKLAGAEGLYRIRAGYYRIVYEVDTKTKLVTIHYVRHRREAYRAL